MIAQPPPAPTEPHKESAYYVFQRTLSGNQALPDLRQIIDADSDFLLLSIHGTQTGNYTIRLRNALGRYIYSAAARNANVVGTAQFPVPLIRPELIPAGGSIGLDLVDLSGSSNTVEIVFAGEKWFKTR